MADKEQVMVFPADWINRQCGSYRKLYGDFRIPEMFPKEKMAFMDREEADADPSWKQPIPYVAVFKDGKFFTYRRGKSGGEGRLHDLWSMGVGGHVNESDFVSNDRMIRTFSVCAVREIAEEIGSDAVGLLETISVINDNSTPVGKVHVGILMIFNVQDKNKNTKLAGVDASIKDCRMETPMEIIKRIDKFELWSKIAIIDATAHLLDDSRPELRPIAF